MKITLSGFLKFALVSFLVAGLLFTAATSQTSVEYDPWADINDDGKIDGKDIATLSKLFATRGEPFLAKAALEYDNGWVNITDKTGQYFNITHNLNSTDVIVDITGKTTVGGGVHQRNLGLTGYGPGWSRTYGGTNEEYLSRIIQTTDGGYALAGTTKSFGAGNYDFWLVKTDSAGNMQWNKTYGGTNEDHVASMVQTDDGGYALAGTTKSFGAGNYDFWLVKTDGSGNHEWNKTYGGTDYDGAYSAIQTSDGGYALAGWTDSYDVGDGDVWLVKTNATGNMEWSNTYGGVRGEKAYSVVQTSDGGYALAGRQWFYAAPDWVHSFWLVKTNATGNMEWSKRYGGTKKDSAGSVVQTSDGGYALAGSTSSFGAGGSDGWLVRTDSAGNMEWNQTYGGANDDSLGSIILMSDGGYAIAGWTESFGAGARDAWLIRTDASGNHLWSRTYGGTDTEYGYSLVQTSDGGYAIAGRTYSFGAGGGDGWLVRTDWTGNTGVESGLAWTDSTADTITLYRGATDPYWNYVRVRIWKIKETP